MTTELNERGNPKMSSKRKKYPPMTTMITQVGAKKMKSVRTMSELKAAWTKKRAARYKLRQQQKASRKANRPKNRAK